MAGADLDRYLSGGAAAQQGGIDADSESIVGISADDEDGRGARV